MAIDKGNLLLKDESLLNVFSKTDFLFVKNRILIKIKIITLTSIGIG